MIKHILVDVASDLLPYEKQYYEATRNMKIYKVTNDFAIGHIIYVPFYYYENTWNSLILPTYVNGYNGQVLSSLRVPSPTKSFLLTSSLLLTSFSWDIEAAIFQAPEMHQAIDAVISGITVACAAWFYPQLKLIVPDDKRTEELKRIAEEEELERKRVKEEKLKSETAAANRQQEQRRAKFVFEEEIDRNEGTESISADEARKAMRDALKRLEELRRRKEEQQQQSPPAAEQQQSSSEQDRQVNLDPKGYYAFLGLTGQERTASVEDIRRAFKDMALQHHPDLHADEEAKLIAKANFQKLVSIYSILRDGKL